MHKVIEGEKTRLRPALWGFSDDELRRRYRWSHDDDLQYWSGTIPGGPSYSQFKETVLQRDWPDDGRRMSYAIYTLDNNFIGMVSVYNIDWKRRNGELGVYLGEKRYWGGGYGTDAIIAFLRELFVEFKFESVYLHTYETNVRAQKSYVHVGFHTVDKYRRFSPRIGYHDDLRMEVTAEAFGHRHRLRVPALPR